MSRGKRTKKESDMERRFYDHNIVYTPRLRQQEIEENYVELMSPPLHKADP